jgi:O-antigen/teichoic acid export membrane protein
LSDQLAPHVTDETIQTSSLSAFARGVRDNAFGEVGVQVLRMGSLLLLARALSPQEFGPFRVLLAISAFATLPGFAGVPDALIQRDHVDDAHASTGWWMSVALSTLLATALYIGAPFIAKVMRMPELNQGSRILCIPIILEGAAAVASADLRRRMRFGAVATAEVSAELAFATVSISLLMLGSRQWCLAGGLAARLSVHAIAVTSLSGCWPRAKPALAAARDIWRFSATVLAGQALLIASSNADYIIIGSVLGPAALGVYGMAWDLLRFVPNRLHSVVVRVALPAFCRIKEDNQRLADAYCRIVDSCSRAILPMAVCVAVAAPEILGAVYGPRWVSAAVPLRLLVPGLGLLGLRLAVGPIYYSKDRPALDLWLHGLRLGLIVVILSIVSRFGIASASIAMSGVEGAISILGQLMVCSLIGMRVSRLISAAVPGFQLALLCGVATYCGSAIVEYAGVGGWLGLGAMIVPAAMVLMVTQGGQLRDIMRGAQAT